MKYRIILQDSFPYGKINQLGGAIFSQDNCVSVWLTKT